MTSGSEPLALQAYCDGKDLSQLADHLAQISPGQLTLDATGLTSLTSSCLQILLSADKTCRANGGEMTLTNIAPQLHETLSLLGADTQRFVTEGIE